MVLLMVGHRTFHLCCSSELLPELSFAFIYSSCNFCGRGLEIIGPSLFHNYNYGHVWRMVIYIIVD